ncbi:weak acid resistance [Saccharomyces pastorianus]|uniref:Weak acid resistance n=1 Tax=Saccharomyces pastorianus TaxID=27292 RepID=A0A6C1ECL0_SACPS|nr:weak acid resistance [Saccharomyces pastorianus]
MNAQFSVAGLAAGKESNGNSKASSKMTSPRSDDPLIDMTTQTIIEGCLDDDTRLMFPTKLETTENGKIKRNSFACVCCHSLKQKCVPSDANDIYRKPCQRCLKHKKVCKFDLAKRTRKRKHRSRSSASLESPIQNVSTKGEFPADFKESSLKNNASFPIAFPPDPNTKQVPNSRTVLPGLQQSLSDLWSTLSQPPSERVRDTEPTPSEDRIVNKSTQANSENSVSTNISLLASTDERTKNGGAPVIYSSYNSPIPMPSIPTSTNSEASFKRRPSVVGNKETCNGKMKRKKNSYSKHMTRSFRKQLQSLIISQKGKIRDISMKLDTWSKQWNDLVERSMFLPTISDPVSVGIISHEEATLRLHLYKTKISYLSKLPFIKVEEKVSVDELRKRKPILFSVIMSCVSIVLAPKQTTRGTIMKLDSFVLNLITNQIFKANNKSIEIIESLSTLCLWYNFFEWSSKTRYHIFNYICCCLTRDLGPTYVNRSFGMFSDEDPDRFKSPLELYSSGSRLILLVYVSALNISIFLRQSIQARWSHVTEKACQDLIKEKKESNQNDNDKSLLDITDDPILVQFAKMNHVLENIHTHLHERDFNEDEFDDCDFTRNYISKLIEKFHRQLKEIFINLDRNRPRVIAFYYSVEAYLYQYKLAVFIGEKSHALNEKIELPKEITEDFVKCYQCCKCALEEFSKLEPILITSLPLFHTSRIIYTVGMLLLKLRYSVVAIPSFHDLMPLTDDAIALVIGVNNLLEKTSELYPFNNSLYKFRYVIALFCQTYANKVINVADRYNAKREEQTQRQTVNETCHDDKDVRPTDTYETEPQNMEKEQDPIVENNIRQSVSTVPDEMLPVYSRVRDDTAAVSLSINSTSYFNGSLRQPQESLAGSTLLPPPFISNTNISINTDISNIKPSPSSSVDNLNDYLTDINSLAWGVNSLNDEFWTDLFMNDN